MNIFRNLCAWVLFWCVYIKLYIVLTRGENVGYGQHLVVGCWGKMKVP